MISPMKTVKDENLHVKKVFVGLSMQNELRAERTHFPGDMAEVALAHHVASAVEASYRRGDMIEKRRTMMAAWADFLTGAKRSGKVVRIR